MGDKVEKMRREVINALAALEPYKDGKGNDFWIKHRTLVAAGSSFRSVDVLPVMKELMPATMKDAFVASGHSLFLQPADNLCPLKVGDELFIGAPDGALNPDVQFRFDVALHEPDIVSQTVADFKPHL